MSAVHKNYTDLKKNNRFSCRESCVYRDFYDQNMPVKKPRLPQLTVNYRGNPNMNRLSNEAGQPVVRYLKLFLELSLSHLKSKKTSYGMGYMYPIPYALCQLSK